MAGLEPLQELIYHEQQQPGSMLCAQHALNNLLQGNYFSAPDLSVIARDLDALEASYDTSASVEHGSMNMDDTGFFSVQVLERALEVWGLKLVRWRGQEMRRFQIIPHTQLAFILNLSQHWFTLRRFGPAYSNIDQDPGNGHWFNLNSSLSAPEWVGKLYLGMFLQQAETDGYSVFAVTQADPNAPLALPRTEADQIASALPEPTSARPRTTISTSAQPNNVSHNFRAFEDEDLELQAALQASLMSSASPAGDSKTWPQSNEGQPPYPSSSSTEPQVDSGAHTSTVHGTPIPAIDSSAEPKSDPVAASLARNRMMLQRMREEQENAQRDLWEENSSGLTSSMLEARRQVRRRQEEEEAEQLRRAIEESKAMARDSQNHIDESERTERDFGAHEAYYHDRDERVYDDDDEDLQAALKASLEQTPGGIIAPERSSPQPMRLPNQNHPPQPMKEPDQAVPSDKENEESESVLSEDTVGNAEHGSPRAEEIDMEEMRRRRLARFGG